MVLGTVYAEELLYLTVVGSEVFIGDWPVFAVSISAGCFEVIVSHAKKDAAVGVEAAS